MKESAEIEDLQFKWGKKRGTGAENKDVQFYESFTYDGSEYCLYDCVSVRNASKPDSSGFFVGKIIKMWEHNDQRQNPRRVDLLWFFKPSEIPPEHKGVQHVLANELFLASGTGRGLTNENLLEAISGKCNVICISKDIRNPQPSDEEIKSADFLFRRTFDVNTFKISEKIDDQIAGVDVKFLFNRTSCEKKASAVQKVATDIHRIADSLRPNPPRQNERNAIHRIADSLRPNPPRQNERNASDLSGHRKSDYGYKKEKDNECHKLLARKKSTLAEERSNKDSGRHDGELDSSYASGSRRNDCHGKKEQDNEVKKQFINPKSRLAEERCSKDSYGLDDTPQKKRKLDGSVAVSDGRTKMLQKISHDDRKDMMIEKPRLAQERCSKDSYRFDGMPQKKRELYSSAAVSDGRRKMSQTITHDGRRDIRKEKVTGGEVYYQKPSFTEKKQNLPIPRVSEGKETKTATEKDLVKKLSSDCRISKRTEGEMLTDVNYRRHFRVFEVTRKPDAEQSKWFQNIPWEENLRCAEGQGNLVLLQNLDPSYTSNEVENIVYSALNEQCTARMIERTSVTIPHIGEALVIFNTMAAAKRAIRRLEEGCLLLSNGRILVASNAKVNPSANLPMRLFTGHIKLRRRQGMRDAVATSHCSQANTLEFDMAMEWCLHQARNELASKRVFERQMEEKTKLQMTFKPKLD